MGICNDPLVLLLLLLSLLLLLLLLLVLLHSLQFLQQLLRRPHLSWNLRIRLSGRDRLTLLPGYRLPDDSRYARLIHTGLLWEIFRRGRRHQFWFRLRNRLRLWFFLDNDFGTRDAATE